MKGFKSFIVSASIAASTLAFVAASAPSQAQGRPDPLAAADLAEFQRLARSLKLPGRPQPPPPEALLATPPMPDGDARDATNAHLHAAIALYDRAAADPANAASLDELAESRRRFEDAIVEWRGGDTDLRSFLAQLAAAAGQLVDASGAPIADEVGEALALLARRAAGQLVDAHEAAGAGRTQMAELRGILADTDALVAGAQYGPAIDNLDRTFDAGPQLVFDMDRYEQNLRNIFDSRTVGYSYAIARNGLLARMDANGLARDPSFQPSDGPQTAQSPTKEMNIASVSKTLTAVAVLRLLEQRGLSIDSPIAPWLPPWWSTGAGVGGLTFRHLLTQTSGLNNNDGSRPYHYAALKSAIAAGVNASQTFTYQNANFALFRIMIPRLAANPVITMMENLLMPLMQIGLVTDSSFGNAYAATYVQYMRSELFAPMGIDGLCSPNDSSMTLLYNPTVASAGINAGDWTPFCGSGGWYLSAFELAAYLAHMRYNDAILSPQMRQVMNLNFAGWMDPDDYNNSWGDGIYGTYHNHGGDLWYGSGAISSRPGMDSCVMSYPNGVQTAILVNSQGPGYPLTGPVVAGTPTSGYQCAALHAAFDNAWVLVP